MPSLDILVESFDPRKALLFVGCADRVSCMLLGCTCHPGATCEASTMPSLDILVEPFDPRKALLFVGWADRVSPHRVWELVVDFVAGGFYLGGQFYIKGRQ